MIVEMKKASIVVQSAKKRPMLKALRKAGLLHLESEQIPTDGSLSLNHRNENLHKIITTIRDLAGKDTAISQEPLSSEACAEYYETYDALIAQRSELQEQIHHGQIEVTRLQPWGDFDPAEITALEKEGILLYFYTISARDLENLDAEISYLPLADIGKLKAIAVLDAELPPTVIATQLILPKQSLGTYQAELKDAQEQLKETEAQLASGAVHLDALGTYAEQLEMAKTFEEVAAGMEGEDALSWITGYLPYDTQESFVALAKEEGWAYLLQDVSEEDAPPTLVRYRKGTGIIKPVFDILGTVPGYTEADISTWFLLFFTLFFAMIIGDAGYGVVFLLAAALLHKKEGKPTTLVMLIYVLASATVIWGSLTGTWFGSLAILEKVPFLQKLVIPSIANYPELFGLSAVTAQNTVMKFCFIVGTVQLSLACALNVVKKAPNKDISFIADVGWLVSILALYFLVLLLVINTPVNLSAVFATVVAGFVLVILFGEQGPGIPFGKGMLLGLAGIFTTFLDTISAFSNIMSYIRLFAVGMASVAIAQSFNSMASTMNSGFAIVAGIAVLVVGHSLNLVMGLLSVVVHGVRLNLLEFSGQLGMEWTGVAYKPFAQTVEE